MRRRCRARVPPFEELTASLLNHLAIETRDKVVSDLRTKAQNAIDVLVRNLFERTADIGFLAADTDIREMLEEAMPTSAAREAIEARFRDYVAKYSVYSDIVLVDREGAIRARLSAHPAQTARHGLIDEALSSSGAYVEHYGVSISSRRRNRWSMPGASRIAPSARSACSCWSSASPTRWRGSSASCCRRMTGPSWAAPRRRARSSPAPAPFKCRRGLSCRRLALQGRDPVLKLGGRQYLAVACRSSGYQGYMGPGWIGLGLLPLEAAFAQGDGALGARIDDGLLAAVTGHSGLFSEDLLTVSRQAAMIQRDLNRSVWNGSIRQAGSTAANAAFSKILLWEISNAGRRTQAVFDASIGDLHRTVVAAIMEKCHSRAAFAIDVMDRNLYERANDCRWWALNATFARVLSEPTPEGARHCGEILATINSLYTVYSNLILFDAKGVVIAVSQPGEAHLVGETLAAEWVQRTLALRSDQHYAVSGFEPSPLYAEASTLIYTAAVQAPAGGKSVGGKSVGGIAIVFDSTPQFGAILQDSLPADEAGAALPGAFTLLVAGDGRIISSTEPRFAVGASSPIVIDPQGLANAGDLAAIRTFEGKHVAVGAALSKGYREYKTSDGHHADVVALCVVPLGDIAASAGARPSSAAANAIAARRPPNGVEAFEAATFHIGRHWLGVKARDVIEAVDLAGLKPSAQAGGRRFARRLQAASGRPCAGAAAGAAARHSRRSGRGPADRHRACGRPDARARHRFARPIPEIPVSELQPLRDLTAKLEVPALGVVAARDAQAGSGRHVDAARRRPARRKGRERRRLYPRGRIVGSAAHRAALSARARLPLPAFSVIRAAFDRPADKGCRGGRALLPQEPILNKQK
jgi:hypothetical protein